MSSHTTVQGKSRKVATLLNGPRDNDCIAFDIYATVAAGNATTTTLIADSQIPTGWYVHVDDYKFSQTGTTWSAGTNFILQDSAGVAFVTITVANSGMPTSTTWKDRVIPATRTPITEALAMGIGGTASKGLQLKITGDMSAGDPMTVRIKGVIRPHVAEVFG